MAGFTTAAPLVFNGAQKTMDTGTTIIRPFASRRSMWRRKIACGLIQLCLALSWLCFGTILALAWFITGVDPETGACVDGLGRTISAAPTVLRPWLFGAAHWAGWIWLIIDQICFWSFVALTACAMYWVAGTRRQLREQEEARAAELLARIIDIEFPWPVKRPIG